MKATVAAVAAAAVWGTALAATHVPGASGWLSLALWGGALATLIWMLRSRRGGIAVVALVIAAAAASHVWLAQPPRHAGAAITITGGRALDVTAVASSKVESSSSGALRFDAQASVITVGGKDLEADVPIVISVAPADVDDRSALDLGSVIIAHGTAMPADVGERAVLVVFASRGVEVLAPPQGVLALASDLRAALVANAVRLPGEGAGLLPGLAVGDTSAVSARLDAAMKTSSLSHLTAVSGANCAIVVGLFFALAAGLGARRAVRVAVAMIGLAGFVVLVTAEASVIRAAAMAAIAMLGLLLGRPAAGLSVLCVAVTALLVFDPWLSASLGFALSAAATGALLVVAPPLARGLARIMPKAIALALAVPLAAQLACGPLLVLINPVIPLYGVLANIVAGPAAPVATITGLLACLAAPLPWLADGLTALAWLPASWIAASALTVAQLPATSLPWFDGWLGAATLAGLGAALMWIVTKAGSLRRRDLVVRAVAVLTAATTAGALAGGAALDGPAGVLALPRDWSIAACDVGQGDAVLVRSAGIVGLIDTGPEPGLLAACLSRFGISRIDLLVLTHFDLDHVGGVEATHGMVGTFLHGPPSSAHDERIISDLAAGGAQPQLAQQGMAGSLGDARWSVLWPRAGGHVFDSGNDASVVVDVRGPGFPTAVFLGDLSAASQRALAASGRLRPPYRVVKVAHHGSVDQDAGLYEAIRPMIALITVGKNNDYGHPRQETLDVLSGLGAHIARTDLEGVIAVTVTTDGISIWRERSPP